MAPHSSTLAWKIPWTEEPGRLQSTGLLRVGHDWVTSLSLSCIGEGNGNPLQCSCLENPRDGGAWCVAVYGVTQSWTWLKWLSSSSCSSKGIYPVVGLLGHSFAPSFFLRNLHPFFVERCPASLIIGKCKLKINFKLQLHHQKRQYLNGYETIQQLVLLHRRLQFLWTQTAFNSK